MARSDLRIYLGPDQSHPTPVMEMSSGRRCVTLPIGEVLPLLADAVGSERTWLRDFDDDQMTISTDLYEVLLAYRHYRRPSA